MISRKLFTAASRLPLSRSSMLLPQRTPAVPRSNANVRQYGSQIPIQEPYSGGLLGHTLRLIIVATVSTLLGSAAAVKVHDWNLLPEGDDDDDDDKGSDAAEKENAKSINTLTLWKTGLELPIPESNEDGELDDLLSVLKSQLTILKDEAPSANKSRKEELLIKQQYVDNLLKHVEKRKKALSA